MLVAALGDCPGPDTANSSSSSCSSSSSTGHSWAPQPRWDRCVPVACGKRQGKVWGGRSGREELVWAGHSPPFSIPLHCSGGGGGGFGSEGERLKLRRSTKEEWCDFSACACFPLANILILHKLIIPKSRLFDRGRLGELRLMAVLKYTNPETDQAWRLITETN